jgi:hypothetical protein
MTIIIAVNTGLNDRRLSVTGAFYQTLRMPGFYRQPGWKTMRYLLEANAYTVFIARVNRRLINPHRVVTTLIPIGQYLKLTASLHPAVSSLEAYQTPAS